MVKGERTRVYEVAPAAMWKTIGDFHALHTWHPGIADSRPSEDGKARTLVLPDDGGTIIETQTGEGDLHYSYRIDESPLPVKDYESTVMVRDADGSAEVIWSAEFEVDGVTEEEATELMHGFIDAGFDNIGASA